MLLPDRFWAFLGSSCFLGSSRTIFCTFLGSRTFLSSSRTISELFGPGQFPSLFGFSGSFRTISRFCRLRVSELFWAPPGRFLTFFGLLAFLLLPHSFGASGSLFKPLGSSQTVSQPFWAPPGQFLLLPLEFDQNRALLLSDNSCRLLPDSF